MTGIIVGPSASGITFGAVRYQLDVVKQLAGSTCAVGAASCGSVSSDVSGIACGTSCSGTYDSGQVVVLT
jgi:hypothetical protein